MGTGRGQVRAPWGTWGGHRLEQERAQVREPGAQGVGTGKGNMGTIKGTGKGTMGHIESICKRHITQ